MSLSITQIIVFMVGGEVVLAIIFILGWWIYNKNRFNAYLCERYMERTWKIKNVVKVPLKKEVFNVGDKDYNVDFSTAIVGNNNKPIIFYDKEDTNPIPIMHGMSFIDTVKSAKIQKLINDGSILKHLSNRKMEKQYIYIILGCVIVVGIVSIGAIFLYSQQNNKLLEVTKDFAKLVRQLATNNNTVVIP